MKEQIQNYEHLHLYSIRHLFHPAFIGTIVQMFKCSIVLLFYYSFLPLGQGQNTCISTTGAAADASAMLDVSGTNKGILIPRVALASATTTVTISNPAASLLVYNDGSLLTPVGYYYNSGTSGSPFWVQLLDATALTTTWLTDGNAATVWNTHFFGTTGNVSLRLRTKNTQKMIIDSVGNVGIRTTSAPLNALSIKGNSISIGSALFTIPVPMLYMAGPFGGPTQGGSPFNISDILWTISATYKAYIQNGMRLDGDVLVESGKFSRGIFNGSPPAGSLLHIGTNTTAAGLSIYEKASADADGYDINFRKTRGTVAAPTVISAADELGVINFSGCSVSPNYVTGAAIKAISEGTIASTRVPAHLSFWTGTDAAPTVLTERMRITKAGNVGIAATSPASTLTVGGSIAGKYRAGNTITMTNTDFFINLTGAGACTLPAANSVTAGTIVIICNTTGSAITLNRAGSDTMCNVGVACGSTSVSIGANNTAVRYFSDGVSVWVGW